MIRIKKEVLRIRFKNCMEDVVDSVYNKLASQEDFCTCDICRLDVKAYALNQLPSKYVVTTKGEVYSKIEQLHQQFNVDVTMALIKAIKVVKSNPRHPLDNVIISE